MISESKEGEVTHFQESIRKSESSKGTLQGFADSPCESAKKTPHQFFSKKTKSILILMFYILSFSYSSIYIKNSFFNLHPFQATFFQSFFLTMLLPFSFIRNLFKERVIQKKQNEEEQSTQEIEATILNDNFSLIMDKKFYENYTKYTNTFYYRLLMLVLLYFLSIGFYFFALQRMQPFLCNILYSSCSIVIIVSKFGFNEKFNSLSIIQLILSLCVFVSFLISFLYEYNYESDKMFSLLGMTLMILCIISTCAFVLLLKHLYLKMKNYIRIGELAGYMGFSTIITYFCVMVCIILFGETSNVGFAFFNGFDNGKSIFLTCFEGIILGTICDYSLMKLTEYCSCNLLGSFFIIGLCTTSIIYLVQKKIVGIAFYLYIFSDFLALSLLIMVLTNMVIDEEENEL